MYDDCYVLMNCCIHVVACGECKPLSCCNAPDVTYHNCTPTLAIFGLSCDIPSWFGFVFVLHFAHVMHFISCHHVHLICIRVRLMHPSIFPVVRFVIRHSYVL